MADFISGVIGQLGRPTVSANQFDGLGKIGADVIDQNQQQSQDQEAQYIGAMLNATPEQRQMILAQGIEAGVFDEDDSDLASNFDQYAPEMVSFLKVNGYGKLLPSSGEGFTLGEGQTRYNSSGQVVATNNSLENKNMDEIRKEARGEFRNSRKEIAKKTSDLNASYKKVENLAKNVSNGNRNAVPQLMVAMVKLGDPGSIVSTTEMRGAVNATDPVAAVMELLISKGTSDVVAQSIASKVDALKPENIDLLSVLEASNSLLSSSIPSIQDEYSELSGRASSNLTKDGYKSIFSDDFSKKIGGLSSMQFDPSYLFKNPQNLKMYEWAIANPNEERAEKIMNKLRGTPINDR
jgi:hypothetical protein